MKTFLARVRRATIVVAAVAGIAGATYASLPSGLALAAGAAWSLVNLLLLELLIRAATTPGGEPASVARRTGWALGGMALLFAAGGWLLFHTPARWLVAGFSLPFAVTALKAFSSALLASPAWRALVRSPWRATAAVAALILAAWWLMPSGSRGERAAGDTAMAPATGAEVRRGHGEAPAAAEGMAQEHGAATE